MHCNANPVWLIFSIHATALSVWIKISNFLNIPDINDEPKGWLDQNNDEPKGWLDQNRPQGYNIVCGCTLSDTLARWIKIPFRLQCYSKKSHHKLPSKAATEPNYFSTTPLHQVTRSNEILRTMKYGVFHCSENTAYFSVTAGWNLKKWLNVMVDFGLVAPFHSLGLYIAMHVQFSFNPCHDCQPASGHTTPDCY